MKKFTTRFAYFAMLAAWSNTALARSPFDVGISEGGGNATGVFGWILAQQMALEQGLTAAVHRVVASPWAAVTLAALSFGYGVFHAAGPGHGKAVIASYMVANEQALRRGLILSFLAAMLQGAVAVALVGVLALIVNATAQTMQASAHVIELLSFAGIALFGAWLVWRKGGTFVHAMRAEVAKAETPSHIEPVHAHHDHAGHAHGDHDHSAHVHVDHAQVGQPHDDVHKAHAHPTARQSELHGYETDVHDAHVHDDHCGHFHAPDPKTLGAEFSWRAALTTIVVAGSRPCSGAILVLVFALSKGIFWAGIVATLAMSLGTALTTGVLAAFAVLFKNIAVGISGKGSGRAALVLKGLEFAAACVVLITGLGLFFGLANYGL